MDFFVILYLVKSVWMIPSISRSFKITFFHVILVLPCSFLTPLLIIVSCIYKSTSSMSKPSQTTFSHFISSMCVACTFYEMWSFLIYIIWYDRALILALHGTLMWITAHQLLLLLEVNVGEMEGLIFYGRWIIWALCRWT